MLYFVHASQQSISWVWSIESQNIKELLLKKKRYKRTNK
jgi:hypothetical protein